MDGAFVDSETIMFVKMAAVAPKIPAPVSMMPAMVKPPYLLAKM